MTYPMCQDYSVTKTKIFLTKFFKTFSKKTISPSSREDVLVSVGFVCFGCLFRHYCASVQCGCSLRRSFVYVLMFLTSKNTHEQFKIISPNSRMDVLASVGFVCFGCLFRHYCVSVQCGCSLRRSSVYVLMLLTSEDTH